MQVCETRAAQLLCAREKPTLMFSFFSCCVRSNNEAKHFTPVQSDTEFEVSTRPKGCEECDITSSDDPQGQMSHRPSWRWGELPSPIPKSEMQELPRDKEPAAKERDGEFCSHLFVVLV